MSKFLEQKVTIPDTVFVFSGIVFLRVRNDKKYFLAESTEARPLEAKGTAGFIPKNNLFFR